MMEVMKIMATSFRRSHAHSVPQPCSRPLPTHVSTGDSWTLTGKPGSVSCGVTAPFSWFLVHTRFCLMRFGGLVAKSCPTLSTPWTIAHQALCPWDFPGKNTGVDCHFILQGIFPTQESNPGLLHCRQILYQLKYDEV